MGDKRSRKKSAGSGVRKIRASRKNNTRKSPVVADFDGLNFIRHQSASRWPTEATLVKAHELAIDKRANRRGKPGKPVRPQDSGFLLLDCLVGSCPKALETVLTAASLSIKKVRRYPGWILERTYNLKDRPIQFI